MIKNTILPWQCDAWEKLWRQKEKQCMPHALLLSGMAGIGKLQFADHFSRTVLCQQPNGNIFCGQCHACRLTNGRVHPNVLWIEPEKEGQAIKVDQIRAANEFIQQSALDGAYQFIIIHPAHCMNMNAANALLKTLEEPAQGSIIILISDQSEHLPSTILSRCQRVILTCPEKITALRWLKEELAENTPAPELLLALTYGAPLAALRLANSELLKTREELYQLLFLLSQKQTSPIKAAAKAQDLELLQFFDFMLAWVMDLLKLQLGATHIINNDFKQQLEDTMLYTSIKHNIQFLDEVQQFRAQTFGGINFNKLLMIENVLIRWSNKGPQHVSS